MYKTLVLTALIASGMGAASAPTFAQEAGTTVLGITAIESTQVAMGWSVKKSLLGRTVYNESGAKVGRIEDLIISPEKNVSYVIVGAGGFIGIGRHDVAIPVSQIREKDGRMLMPGATKDIVKSMPTFTYASGDAERTKLISSAELDIAQAERRLVQLQDKAAAAGADVKAQVNMQVTSIRLDLKSLQEKLAILKSAGTKRWKEFETDVRSASDRLRKSLAAAV